MREIHICIGSSCHLKGSYNVVQEMQQIIEEKKLHDHLTIKATFCMEQCQDGVSVYFEGTVFSLLPGTCKDFYSTTIAPRLGEIASAE